MKTEKKPEFSASPTEPELTDSKDRLIAWYRRHRGSLLAMSRVYRYCHSIGREYDTEDLACSVFDDLLKRANANEIWIESPEQFAAFVRHCVRTKARTIARRKSSHVKSLEHPGEVEARSDCMPDEVASRAEAVANIRAAINSLAPQHRDIVRKRLEGRSWVEISRLTGIHERTIRYRYARALNQLRRLVNGGF